MIKKLKQAEISIGCILVCIYFISLPLTIALNEHNSSFLKALAIPIAAYLLIEMVFYRGKIRFNSVHLFSALFLLSVLATLFANHSYDSLLYVRGYIETLALLFVMTLKEYSENEIEAFEVSQLILLGILLVLGLTGAEWYGDRNTFSIFNATSDPNYFAGMFLLPIAVAMKKLKENKFYMTVCPIMIIIGSYLILSTGSRGGLLALIVTIACFVLLTTKGGTRKFLGILTAVVIAVIMWMVVIPLLPESVSQRFSIAEIIESRGTERIDIWLSMFDTIKQSTWELICGRGINSYHLMMKNGKWVEVVAHNQFIQSLYNQGFFGFFSFILMTGAAIFRNIKHRKYISAAMFGTLALAFSLSINPSIKSFWNLLIYSAFMINITSKHEEVDSDEIRIQINDRKSGC